MADQYQNVTASVYAMDPTRITKLCDFRDPTRPVDRSDPRTTHGGPKHYDYGCLDHAAGGFGVTHRIPTAGSRVSPRTTAID